MFGIDLNDPRTWVALAFLIFVGASYKKISALLINALDQRSAKIKSDLDEARHLRNEAEAVLADYKKKQAEYVKEAEAMLASARRDADELHAYTEKELKTALDGRMKQALEKIAQEESKAIADVRNHVVDISLAAARTLIVDHLNTMPQEELIKLAISDIERKIH